MAYETANYVIVFFDLETGGFSYSHDILQISARSGDIDFSTYITPTKLPIDYDASQLHGLTADENRNLYKNGKPIPTDRINSPRIAFIKFLNYLKNFEKKCILVAHNCPYDSHRLVVNVDEWNLAEEFEKVVAGFSDTWKLFKRKFPEDSSHKLTELAKNKLGLDINEAHDASYDVYLLQRLSMSFLTAGELIDGAKDYNKILKTVRDKLKCQQLMSTVQPLAAVLSKALRGRLILADISYKKLIKTYRKGGVEETIELLKGNLDKNGKPTIIKRQQDMKKILEFLRNESSRHY